MAPCVASLALPCLVAVVAAQSNSYASVTDQMRADAAALIAAALAPGANTVYERLAYVCDTFGPRLSGSAALESAIDHIVATAQADGMRVYTQPVSVPVWVRGDEWAVMTSPRVKKLHMLGLGGSIGTGGVNITAPVLVVNGTDDLNARAADAVGKIVLFNVPFTNYPDTVYYRSLGGVLAAAKGAVAALVRSVGPYGIQTPHTGSSQPASIPSACVSMEDATQMQRMQDRNQPVVVSLYMEAQTLNNSMSRNIVFELPGTEKPDEFVVFGGHIDSWDVAEGAMDDGGGSFASWEALRLIQNLNISVKRTLRAVMWVNEENGANGGAAFALNMSAQLDNISIAIESDEGAFSPYSLAFSGHPAAQNQLAILSELLSPLGADNVTIGGEGTDIGPMCARGVPCAGLEVLDPRIGNFQNNPCLGFSSSIPPGANVAGSISPGYFWFHHTAGDTIDRMDPTQLQTVAAAMAVWAVSIGNLPELLPRSGDVPPLPNGNSNAPQLSGAAIGGIAAAALLGIVGVVALFVWRARIMQCGRSKGRDDAYVGNAYEDIHRPGASQLYSGEQVYNRI